MPSLTDLLTAAQRSEQITVLGLTFDVRSLELGEIAQLFHRFPGLNSLMSGSFDQATLAQSAAPAIGALIAAGTGHGGDEAEEQAAAKLPIAIQLDLVEAIMRQTAPEGAGPFMKRLVGILGSGSPAEAIIEPSVH